MRLLQSILPRDHQTKKPQRKFLTHLFGLLLMLPGHMTFRNLSRYSPYHEKGCGSFGTVAQRQAMASFCSAIAGHLW